MSSIFLSHNHKDKTFVRKLAERLEAHGIRTWVDEAEIRVGDSLIAKIESAIRDFTYLGVILSSNSVTSHWVKKEVNMALTQEIDGEQIKVLPLLIEPCEIPTFLSDKLYADFTKNFDDGFETLLRRLIDDLHQERYKSRRAMEFLQQFYQDWLAFGRLDHMLLKLENIDVILTHIPIASLSPGILEFLLTSIASSGIHLTDFNPRIKMLLEKSKDHLPNILIQLLRSSNPKNSSVAIDIVETMGISDAVRELVKLIDVDIINKLDTHSLRVFIRLIEKEGLRFQQDLVTAILAKYSRDPDWFSLSYCIREYKLKSCLLIGDNSAFANKLGKMAKDAGFVLISIPVFSILSLDAIEESALKIHKLIILVRGNNFELYGNNAFYKRLENYIKNGGIVFGTSFVGWETRRNLDFIEALPFKATSTYDENTQINCILTEKSPIKVNLTTMISLHTTYEVLNPSEGSIIWLETEKIPVFGYKPFYDGLCYYLNMCQHWCHGNMLSPFEASEELNIYFSQFFKWLFENLQIRENSS